MSDPDSPAGPRPTPRAPVQPPAVDPSIWTDESTASERSTNPSRSARPPAGALAAAEHPASDTADGSAATWLRILAVFITGVLVGALAIVLTHPKGNETAIRATNGAAGTSTIQPSIAATASTSSPIAETTAAAPNTVPGPVPTRGTTTDIALAAALSPLKLPSDCPLPLGIAESLPNTARAYRGGVHEGIDFICGEYGRNAVAAMDGQVLLANASFVDPTPDERLEILNVAKQIGRTPPWTLAMLFGRFVVLDHGIRPGVGHVVTIYAHLNKIDQSIVPGHRVRAGDRIGEIGKAGTESAGTGEVRPQAIHLHWEIHVDDHFLGQGMSSSETSNIYAKLFGR